MGSPVFIFVTTLMVSVILTATLISQYQRETTSVEDKYTNRSAAEIDATYHQSYLASGLITEDGFYDDNIIGDNEVEGSPIATQASNNPNDFDEDGIPNATDSDPRNPDADGDGTIDGEDPKPTDPTSGKTDTPPASPVPPEVKQVGKLEIGDFYTNVRNLSRGATQWDTHTSSKPGDQIAFIIHAELTNTSDYVEYEATIVDRLQSAYLEYKSATIEINNGDPEALSGDSWMDGYTIKVPAGQIKIVDIRFNAIAKLATLNRVVVATNFAWVTTTSNDKKTDIAFVSIDSYPVN